MQINIKVDLAALEEAPAKDGQVNIKLPKPEELRFKQLNIKHEKQLSRVVRDFMIQLMDEVEGRAS